MKAAECLLGRYWPDRRVNTERREVDIDLTPNRRATDRREMANTLIHQAFKASEKRFTGAPVTGHGELV
jgi:hypothetical protein